MPKFRVKFRGISHTVFVENFDGGESPLTLQQLKATVGTSLALCGSRIELSLNGRDALQGDELSLRQLGVVPGDNFHVLLKPGYNPIDNTSTATPSTSTGACRPPSPQRSPPFSSHQPTPYQPCVAAAVLERSMPLTVPNRAMTVPLLVRESTLNALPEALLHAFHCAHIQDAHDALMVVIDVLMTEIGFNCQEFKVPSECPQGVLRLQYQLLSLSCPPLHFVYVVLGQTAKVLIKMSAKEPVYDCVLKPSDYIIAVSHDPMLTYKNLPMLSRIFKDKVAYPARVYLTEDAGIQVPTLHNLVVEVQLLIMKHLKAEDLAKMSLVCQHFNTLAAEPCLWKRLLQKDFNVTPDNQNSGNYFELYKQKYLEVKRRRRVHAQPFYMPPQAIIPGFLPYPPIGGRPILPPGSLGGDFDRDPFLPGMDPFNPLRLPNRRPSRGGMGPGFPGFPPGGFM